MLKAPLLCHKLEDLASLSFPCLLTPKFDGLRCLTVGGRAVSRNWKPLRNRYISSILSALPDGCDGELVVPDGDFTDAQSGVSSADGRPAFLYCVFDYVGPGSSLDLPYSARVLRIPQHTHVHPVMPYLAEDLASFLRYEEAALHAGYEGVIARTPNAPYEQRRTRNALKWKRLEFDEARVTGFVESRRNENPMVPDELNRPHRPGGASGLGGFVPKGTLGAFEVVGTTGAFAGVRFGIGTGKGLTKALRQRVWDDRPKYVGRTLRYSHQPTVGYAAPRFPSFQSFLEDER